MECWLRQISLSFSQAANLSSDGILRRDLDVFDNTPNGTHPVNTEDEASTEAVKPPLPQSQSDENPQEALEAEPTPPKKVLKPPMPPSKENKPSSPAEQEMSKEIQPPSPTPPNKASDSSEELDNTQIASSTSPAPIRGPIHPPMPPSKDKKPAQTVQWEVPHPPGVTKDSEEESPEETFSEDLGKNDSDDLVNEGDSSPPPETTAFKPPEAELGSAVTEELDETCPALTEPEHSGVALEAEGNPAPAVSFSADTLKPAAPLTESGDPSPQPAKKNPGPLAPPKKKPLNHPEGNQPCDLKEGSAKGPISTESKDAYIPNEGLPTAVISDPSKHKDSQSPTDEPKNKMAAPSTRYTADVTVFPNHPVQKRKQEESSFDDPQRGNGKGASASVVSGGLEPMHDDGSDAGTEPAEGHMLQKGKAIMGARSRAQVLQQTKRRIQPTPPALPLKPSMGKSSSMGDLLSDVAVPGRESALKETLRTSPKNDTNELQNKVALELEDTVELLDTLSSEQETQGVLGAKEGLKGLSPEDLLTKAVEKLRKADEFLQVAKTLKRADPFEKKHRMSW